MIFNPSLLKPQPTHIQSITDLHLDRIPIKHLDAWFKSIVAPSEQAQRTLLLIAGDVCSFPKKNKLRINRLVKALQHYRRVVLVPGNHDFYDMSIEEGHIFWNRITAGTNIRYLYNEFYDFFDIRIVGSTLWSFIPPPNELATLFAINDFKYIRNHKTKEPITIQEFNEMNQECQDYLRCTAEDSAGHLLIFLTHFPPIEYDPNGQFDQLHPLFYYYNNTSYDLEDLANTHPKAPRFWFWGHTHIRGYAPNKTGTSIGSNPLVSLEDSWDIVPEPGELISLFPLTK